jgi:hypothetical protein
MKLPSIIKIPSYQRFHYEPRHYDPIKDDIDERRRRIRRSLDAERGKAEGYTSRGRLEGSFRRRKVADDNSGFLRLIIGAVLFAGVVGYLYFGNIAIYIATGLVLTYTVFKKFFRK